MSNEPVVIVAARRTPIGAFQGTLGSVAAPELSATACRAAIEDSGIDAADIDEVLLGCVLPAGLGQAPARQATIKAGLPVSTGAITVNKVCGSGLQAVMFARREILVGDADVLVAGGMESMTNAPYVLPNARGGYRMGNGQIVDSMINDAEQHAEEDRKRRENAETRNQGEQIIHSTEELLKEQADELTDEEKSSIEAALDELKAEVAKEDATADDIRPKIEATLTASQALAQRLYAKA